MEILRSYTMTALIKRGRFGRESATHKFEIQSVVEEGREARVLHLNVKSKSIDEDYWFNADNFIEQYKSQRMEDDYLSKLAIWQMGNDYVKEKFETLAFPVTIIFQIILFVVMELYRYWRDKKKYEELENGFHDTIITYNDNEYCKSSEVKWR